MQTYFLSVLRPTHPTIAAAGCGHHVMTTYEIEVAKPLQWVREHADEMAMQFQGPGYDALMVSDIRDPALPLTDSIVDQTVLGLDTDRTLIQWDAERGVTYSCGETPEAFGIECMTPAERERCGVDAR